MGRLYSGTSGFAYAAWKPDFYPQKLPARAFLSHYATRLNAVEINYTFRQLPKAATLESWVAQTPSDFVFACKAHQRITHINRLRESEFTAIYFKALEPLRASKRLGPVLFQLPPNMKADPGLLGTFLAGLPEDIRFTFEFRNPTWLVEETYRLLENHDVSLCQAESDKLEIPPVCTAKFVYFRLRKDDYTPPERRDISRRAGEQLAAGRDVYAFFKHEETPAGALYAEELLAAHRNQT